MLCPGVRGLEIPKSCCMVVLLHLSTMAAPEDLYDLLGLPRSASESPQCLASCPLDPSTLLTPYSAFNWQLPSGRPFKTMSTASKKDSRHPKGEPYISIQPVSPWPVLALKLFSGPVCPCYRELCRKNFMQKGTWGLSGAPATSPF
jgi:hypothetical protein